MKNLLLTTFILCSSSASFANYADVDPVGQPSAEAITETTHPNMGQPRGDAMPDQEVTHADGSNPIANFFHRAKEVISGALHRDSDDEIQSEPSASDNREIRDVPLRKDDNCLVLDKGNDNYPLYKAADSEIQAINYWDPQLPISISLNGNAAQALKISRGRNIEKKDWPIVLHGPLKFCGSVNIEFSANQSNYQFKREDRLELGPYLTIIGHKNVSIVSSQVKYLEINAACTGKQAYDPYNPCIRFISDRRTTHNRRLYIKHEGKELCQIESRDLTDVEGRLPGHNREHPVRCDDLSGLSSDIRFADEIPPQPASAPVQVGVGSPVPVIIANPVNVRCDGPYVARILKTPVPLNYGLVAVSDPGTPVPEKHLKHRVMKKAVAKKSPYYKS